MKIGDTVWAESGSYGSEQGSLTMTWHPFFVEGVIVRTDEKGRALLEGADGERKWFPLTACKIPHAGQTFFEREIARIRGGTGE